MDSRWNDFTFFSSKQHCRLLNLFADVESVSFNSNWKINAETLSHLIGFDDGLTVSPDDLCLLLGLFQFCSCFLKVLLSFLKKKETKNKWENCKTRYTVFCKSCVTAACLKHIDTLVKELEICSPWILLLWTPPIDLPLVYFPWTNSVNSRCQVQPVTPTRFDNITQLVGKHERFQPFKGHNLHQLLCHCNLCTARVQCCSFTQLSLLTSNKGYHFHLWKANNMTSCL